ncbi:GatA family leaderless bacteriocin [Priestia flexa]|jgi:hypothetical protein
MLFIWLQRPYYIEREVYNMWKAIGKAALRGTAGLLGWEAGERIFR